MNIVKRTALISLLIVFSVYKTQAQDKIIERSAKGTPEWIGAVSKDFIAISATDSSIDGAQKKCMTDILQQIVNSVAVNIVSTENSSSQQISENEMISMVERYASYVRTQGAQLPFLTGISLSNAMEVYWEKYHVKPEKRYYYVYYVKYPFSESERNGLITEFKKIDKGYNDQLIELQENFDKFTQIEFIDRAISDLEPLRSYFFDNARIETAKALQVKYRKEYENISIVPMGATLGEFNYCLKLNGRIVTTSKQATAKSNCASNITIRQINDGYKVDYDYGDCLDDEENTIELTYQFGGRSLRYKFPFNVKEDKVQITPRGMIEIEIISASDDHSDNALLTLQMDSKYDGEFVVEEVMLSVPGIKNNIRTGSINKKFHGKGTHTLTLRCNILKVKTESKSILTQGTMRIKNAKTGDTQNRSIQLPYKIN